VKLVESIRQAGCDVGSGFAVQPLCLNEPGTSGRVPERPSEVPSGLGVVVRALPTSSVTASNGQSSESDVVHDHIRLRQHQIAAIAGIVFGIRSRQVKHAGSTESGETVGGSSSGGELSPGRGSAEMISDGRPERRRSELLPAPGAMTMRSGPGNHARALPPSGRDHRCQRQ
jgi:hypothetical protein